VERFVRHPGVMFLANNHPGGGARKEARGPVYETLTERVSFEKLIRPKKTGALIWRPQEKDVNVRCKH